MQVSFNPNISQQNFKALNTTLISSKADEAEKLVMRVDKGQIEKTAENVTDLGTAISLAIKNCNLEAKYWLELLAQKWSAK